MHPFREYHQTTYIESMLDSGFSECYAFLTMHPFHEYHQTTYIEPILDSFTDFANCFTLSLVLQVLPSGCTTAPTLTTILKQDFLSTYPPVSVLFSPAPFSAKALQCLGGGTSRSFHNFHALERDYEVLKAYEALLQELDSIKLDNASFPDYFLVNEAERYFIMTIRTKHIEENIRTKHIEEYGLTELSETAKINKMSEEL